VSSLIHHVGWVAADGAMISRRRNGREEQASEAIAEFHTARDNAQRGYKLSQLFVRCVDLRRAWRALWT
jgi:hypothetical protein